MKKDKDRTINPPL